MQKIVAKFVANNFNFFVYVSKQFLQKFENYFRENAQKENFLHTPTVDPPANTHAKHGLSQQPSSVIITAWDREGLVDFAACNIPKLPHAPPLFKA